MSVPPRVALHVFSALAFGLALAALIISARSSSTALLTSTCARLYPVVSSAALVLLSGPLQLWYWWQWSERFMSRSRWLLWIGGGGGGLAIGWAYTLLYYTECAGESQHSAATVYALMIAVGVVWLVYALLWLAGSVLWFTLWRLGTHASKRSPPRPAAGHEQVRAPVRGLYFNKYFHSYENICYRFIRMLMKIRRVWVWVWVWVGVGVCALCLRQAGTGTLYIIQTSDNTPQRVDYVSSDLLRRRCGLPARAALALTHCPGRYKPRKVVRSVELDVARIRSGVGSVMPVVSGRGGGSSGRSASASISDKRVEQEEVVDAIVSLIEPSEVDAMHLSALFPTVTRLGMISVWFPLRDKWVPRSIRDFVQLQVQVVTLLRQVRQSDLLFPFLSCSSASLLPSRLLIFYFFVPLSSASPLPPLTSACMCMCRVQGKRVVVHCNGGKGRAATVAVCALITCGMTAAEAIAAVRSARTGTLRNPFQIMWVHHYAAQWMQFAPPEMLAPAAPSPAAASASPAQVPLLAVQVDEVKSPAPSASSTAAASATAPPASNSAQTASPAPLPATS
jgi:hypothetical protein